MKERRTKFLVEGKLDEAKDIKKIIKAETRRYQFQRIKTYVGKEKNSLKCLYIPPHQHPNIENTQEEFIVRKKELEKLLIDRNSKPLHQAH